MAGFECKLCFKKFVNGKALGGHMRVHYAALPLASKPSERHEHVPFTESTFSLVSSLEEGCEKPLFCDSKHGPRNKPEKRSFHSVDLGLFDSETVSNSSDSTGGRWWRSAKEMSPDDEEAVEKGIKRKPSLKMVDGSVFTEEDGALCLIMLSRDVWRRKDCFDSAESRTTTRRIYKCNRCNRGFKASQGLGSHLRICKSIKISPNHEVLETEGFRKKRMKKNEMDEEEQVQMHECPFCDRTFNSGKALGGHKKSHFLDSKCDENSNVSDGFDESSIGLNFPESTMEEEDEDLVI